MLSTQNTVCPYGTENPKQKPNPIIIIVGTIQTSPSADADLASNRKTIVNRQPMPRAVRCLTTEAVQGAALSLQGVDNIQGCDGLALGVLGVGDGVTDDALEEGLEDGAGLLVDHCGRVWSASRRGQTRGATG